MIEHNEFRSLLHAELQELTALQQKLTASLTDAPEGSLHVLQRQGKKPEYYRYESKEKRKYISKKQASVAIKLAQKEYEQNLLVQVEQRLHAGTALAECYTTSLRQTYDDMSNAKRQLVVPYELSDQEYVQKWYEQNQGNMNPYPIATNMYSNRGEQVRSKSEKIIADLFDKYDIPYIYEPKLMFRNGRITYPDFMLLNVRLRKTWTYEHFGIMSDGSYAEKASEKINLYMMNDYMPGNNLLFSMESQAEPLNIKIIEKIIEKYLM